ncbi:MAG: 3-deoxy-manno-octulosonate cytidylyltransferase [Desulfobacteraceae bacterium]|nr:3-deoxy-manno-octulosonate cytidylyltransferase [Desulfobacteraceae bacterium]
MKIFAIIPSRYESSRFEGKPLARILGKPMIQWVYERTQKADIELADVFVATDDRRIMDVVKGFGGKAVMTSPAHRSGTDRIAEAAQITGIGMDDLVLNVQGDQPAFHSQCLKELVEPFDAQPGIVMSTLVFPIVNPEEKTDPKHVKTVMDADGFALYFSRATIPHDRDKAGGIDLYKHLGFYAYKRRFLELFRSLPEGNLERIEKLEQLRALEYGYRIKVVVSAFDSPEVDVPEDITRIESWLGTQSQE